MSEKMTPIEFANKCVWEGGDLISGFEYGLTHCDLDDSDPKFKQLVKNCHTQFLLYKAAEMKFENEYGNLEDFAYSEESEEDDA